MTDTKKSSPSKVLGTICLATAVLLPTPAAAVDAEAFFSDCPGPIVLTEDTEVTGKATIDGSCELRVEDTFSLSLVKTKLSFDGDFFIFGDASGLVIDRSKIEAAGETGIMLDSQTTMQISQSRITAKGGTIVLPRKTI